MSDSLTKYQKIILADVQNAKYEQHRRALPWLFGALFSVLALIGILTFPNGGIRFWQMAHRWYHLSIIVADRTFKEIVYVYQYLLLFVAFLGLIGIFLVFALFAYDMQARNGIIRSLLEKQTDQKENER